MNPVPTSLLAVELPIVPLILMYVYFIIFFHNAQFSTVVMYLYMPFYKLVYIAYLIITASTDDRKTFYITSWSEK